MTDDNPYTDGRAPFSDGKLTQKYERELYAKCPRCRGRRYVSACTEPSNGFTAGRWEDFACPMCSGTGEADMDDIIQMAVDENAERDQ